MARFAYEMNMNNENYGARRLQSITQKIIQDLSFEATNYKGKIFTVDAQFVRNKLKDLVVKSDLRQLLI